MIFDIAGTFDVVGSEGAPLEFIENRPVRLPHDLGKDIEAATVRHAEDDVLDAQGAAALDNLLQRRNHGFAAVETEALRARVFDLEELLESLRLDKLVEHRALAFLGELNFLAGAFDPLIKPAIFIGIGDMHELDPYGAAIGAAQDLQHFGNGRELRPKNAV